MKKFAILFAGLFLMTFAFQSVNAQNTASVTDASAAANIIEEISLTNTTPLNFGDIVANNQESDIKVASTGNRSLESGNATLLTQFTTHSAAAFAVTGQNNSTYLITLPANGVVFLSNTNGNDIPVKDFETTGYSGLDGTGNDSFNVGATITVGADQEAGLYEGEYEVTVTYN